MTSRYAFSIRSFSPSGQLNVSWCSEMESFRIVVPVPAGTAFITIPIGDHLITSLPEKIIRYINCPFSRTETSIAVLLSNDTTLYDAGGFAVDRAAMRSRANANTYLLGDALLIVVSLVFIKL